MEEFKKKFPDVAELLYNQKLIEDLEQNAPEAYNLFNQSLIL